jgi:hypothetical protein
MWRKGHERIVAERYRKDENNRGKQKCHQDNNNGALQWTSFALIHANT